MLMGIDVGNTNITFGIFDGENLISSFRIMTTSLLTSDEIGVRIKTILDSKGFEGKISYTVISSVVPGIMDSLINGVRSYLNVEPLILKNEMDLGIKLDVDYPKDVGMDRIVDMVAAKTIYGYPCIVVDFGTATTYDLLDKNLSYIAGVTAPGIKTSLAGLVQKAAKLTNIEIEIPNSILAKNTMDSMKAGITFAQIGQTRYIISEMKKESGIDAKVIITGGLGAILKNHLNDIAIYDENLTLHGLRIIFDRIKNENS